MDSLHEFQIPYLMVSPKKSPMKWKKLLKWSKQESPASIFIQGFPQLSPECLPPNFPNQNPWQRYSSDVDTPPSENDSVFSGSFMHYSPFTSFTDGEGISPKKQRISTSRSSAKGPKVRAFMFTQANQNLPKPRRDARCFICEELLCNKLAKEVVVALECGDFIHSECLELSLDYNVEAAANSILPFTPRDILLEGILPQCEGDNCVNKQCKATPIQQEITNSLISRALVKAVPHKAPRKEPHKTPVLNFKTSTNSSETRELLPSPFPKREIPFSMYDRSLPPTPLDREVRESREIRQPRETRESGEYREPKDLREHQEYRETAREHQEITRDYRDHREPPRTPLDRILPSTPLEPPNPFDRELSSPSPETPLIRRFSSTPIETVPLRRGLSSNISKGLDNQKLTSLRSSKLLSPIARKLQYCSQQDSRINSMATVCSSQWYPTTPSPNPSISTMNTFTVKMENHKNVPIDTLKNHFIKVMFEKCKCFGFTTLSKLGSLRLVDELLISFNGYEYFPTVVFFFDNYLVASFEDDEPTLVSLRNTKITTSSSSVLKFFHHDDTSDNQLEVWLDSKVETVIEKWVVATLDHGFEFPVELITSTILIPSLIKESQNHHFSPIRYCS